jgi:hypothetical protein
MASLYRYFVKQQLEPQVLTDPWFSPHLGGAQVDGRRHRPS